MSIKEVPSPIDLRNPEDAVQWAKEVNLKRPWRAQFFDYYAELIQQHQMIDILDIGAGPGDLAKHLLARCPDIRYHAFDFSEAMHKLSRSKLPAHELDRADYIVGDFKQLDWADTLQQYDLVIIHQALHELRNKAYAQDFHSTVKNKLLKAGAIYLVCDHLFADGAMTNHELYMSKQEHLDNLQQAGFEIAIPMEIRGLCLFQCH
ncbi:class I SAM-dependent methyltransferase [Acinetobacter sp. BSP-28]|uniref:class I SAM-dependent methyltransferase n=1 Tax=Acinetobacter sp. BSP-28 TaxID=3344661 RepID=UPI00376F92DB